MHAAVAKRGKRVRTSHNWFDFGSVAVLRKVTSHWILKTTDFNRHYCFSIVWGLGSEAIALGSYDSCYMTK